MVWFAEESLGHVALRPLLSNGLVAEELVRDSRVRDIALSQLRLSGLGSGTRFLRRGGLRHRRADLWLLYGDRP